MGLTRKNGRNIRRYTKKMVGGVTPKPSSRSTSTSSTYKPTSSSYSATSRSSSYNPTSTPAQRGTPHVPLGRKTAAQLAAERESARAPPARAPPARAPPGAPPVRVPPGGLPARVPPGGPPVKAPVKPPVKAPLPTPTKAKTDVAKATTAATTKEQAAAAATAKLKQAGIDARTARDKAKAANPPDPKLNKAADDAAAAARKASSDQRKAADEARAAKQELTKKREIEDKAINSSLSPQDRAVRGAEKAQTKAKNDITNATKQRDIDKANEVKAKKDLDTAEDNAKKANDAADAAKKANPPKGDQKLNDAARAANTALNKAKGKHNTSLNKIKATDARITSARTRLNAANKRRTDAEAAKKRKNEENAAKGVVPPIGPAAAGLGQSALLTAAMLGQQPTYIPGASPGQGPYPFPFPPGSFPPGAFPPGAIPPTTPVTNPPGGPDDVPKNDGAKNDGIPDVTNDGVPDDGPYDGTNDVELPIDPTTGEPYKTIEAARLAGAFGIGPDGQPLTYAQWAAGPAGIAAAVAAATAAGVPLVLKKLPPGTIVKVIKIKDYDGPTLPEGLIYVTRGMDKVSASVIVINKNRSSSVIQVKSDEEKTAIGVLRDSLATYRSTPHTQGVEIQNTVIDIELEECPPGLEDKAISDEFKHGDDDYIAYLKKGGVCSKVISDKPGEPSRLLEARLESYKGGGNNAWLSRLSTGY